MKMRDVVQMLDLGNSVAEFDEALERYFVETEPFRALVLGKVDIVAGDKGTGKTAIFRVLKQRFGSIPELKGVEVIPAFNPSGNPVFQRLAQEQVLSEAQYRSVWKAYVLSLVGNWALQIFGPETDSLKALDELLQKTGLRSLDDAPATVFSKILNSIKRIFHPKAAEVKLTISENGIPIVIPRVEFGSGKKEDSEQAKVIPHEEALGLLNRCLTEIDLVAWVALDRLDEAFQGFPEVEREALRALLRTYLDLLEFDHLRLKLFIRRDLFRKVIGGGFVNLTHVNARKIEIVWDEDDLMNLLCERIRENKAFIRIIEAEGATNEQLFYEVFPAQIDPGERKPTAWTWIMSRIRDGNDIKPPRNLIDLVIKAREAQLRSEDRAPRTFTPRTAVHIIEAEAIRRGLGRLSVDRVEDTLLAEAGEASRFIERFRGQKSEYNLESLHSVLGGSKEENDGAIRQLIELGFLEEVGENYKIPLLYREGLEISQGKAY